MRSAVEVHLSGSHGRLQLVFIIYFDEVKHQPGRNEYYWLAGLAVPATAVRELERQVADLSQECFNRSTLSRQTEFHAAALCNRSENFKAWTDIGKRISVFKKLLKIVDSPAILKIWVRLEPARMIAEDKLAELAFMFFVEKVDNLLKEKKAVGLLIGDAENDKVSNATAQTLSNYREGGTPYEFGRDIEHLIDTVHFTHSHLSRMLQLADAYAWATQLLSAATPDTDSLRAEVARFIKEETKLTWPSRYKTWPTEDSRIQVSGT